ncbi:transposable element Tcb2 transposase [Trichonephila inaurata madagascariensis]|uniref:Transposable element Tcb2 transposase n=1 Tax=Trichonephila inaurata madagascariensis TaxID=2747483 RepID=A0A8X6Y9I3_9ARAC|nr:transposable element Tcb2 transposase [Trichonephila inaurata madagascariensis]
MEFRHAMHRLYDEEHSGRPRVTHANTDQNLYEASRKYPFLSAVDLQKELTPTCSVDTVRNRLKQKGLKCRTPARKPFLTQFHRQMRYAYAHSKLHWPVSEWHRVVISDEKIFRPSIWIAQRLYRPIQGSNRFDEQYLVHSSNPVGGRLRFTLCMDGF